MSFSDQFDAYAVLTDLAADTLVLVDERPMPTEWGFDSYYLHYQGRHSGGMGSLIAAGGVFARGSGFSLSGGTFYVMSARPRCLGGDLIDVAVQLKGAFDLTATKTRYRGTLDGQSGENVTVGGTVYPRVATNQRSVSVEVQSFSTTAPFANLAGLGHGGFPPSAPTPPLNIWQSLDPDEAIYHYPNGWVLVDVDASPLPGTNLSLSTAVWDYVFDFSL